ncbi:E3 ubiquitin-protein ligase TRIM62-like [Anomaloglossus baeobatrachus]|uniref:E3 ubiquitin-protein ligase TRIM62-like n=1 Tax=Anomaloglossus baeobatrachus TaxID=238106 RepID=UPI003F4F8125
MTCEHRTLRQEKEKVNPIRMEYLRDKLNCSICLSLYTDPVSLRCGHFFCRSCIVSVLDVQEATGVYSCPDCRIEYPERLTLEKNQKLEDIVERLSAKQPEMETRIFCTYCVKSPVPAVRSCLHCHSSLCDDHLTAHNKAVDHILVKPTDSFGYKKCTLHVKVPEYYLQDTACLCACCCRVGKHSGHYKERLNEASKKQHLVELKQQKAEIQPTVQNLQDHKEKIKEKASEKRKNIRKGFMDIKKLLEMAEDKVLSEVSRQEENIVSQVSQLIQKLEMQENKMNNMEMHLVDDQMRLLQESDVTVCSHGGDKDMGGDGGVDEDLDEGLISLTVHQSMRDIVTNVTSQLGVHVPDILLDVDTAHECVTISEDLKTATDSKVKQEKPKSSGRFVTFPQVLSRCAFSSGQHYWEVESNQIGICAIGLSYSSIEREGVETKIGLNDKSWCLVLCGGDYGICLNSHIQILKEKQTCPTLGLFLDYEAGRLSFYELCDPIRHLHTFTASFIEPLRVLFYLNNGASVAIRS